MLDTNSRLATRDLLSPIMSWLTWGTLSDEQGSTCKLRDMIAPHTRVPLLGQSYGGELYPIGQAIGTLPVKEKTLNYRIVIPLRRSGNCGDG